MYFYTYLSTATRPMSSTDLVSLLEISRANNLTWGITGILLYKSGNFLQLLEGEEAQVRALAARIARDPRHIAITPLISGFTKERQYPDWTMAFPDLDSEAVRSLPGYSPFLNTPLTAEHLEAYPWNAYKLLLAFKGHFSS